MRETHPRRGWFGSATPGIGMINVFPRATEALISPQPAGCKKSVRTRFSPAFPKRTRAAVL